MSKNVVVVGAGVIGLSAAAECARRGHRVVVIERAPEQRGASLGNAGMIVPSHFIPLAAPGMVALGLKWMWNPESPFYIKPRPSWDLFTWAFRFWKASTREHVARAAPLLRDLHLASRDAYLRLAQDGEDFGLVTKGLLMLCKTEQALEEEVRTATRARELGVPAEVLNAKQVGALEPNVTMDIAGGVYFPKDCHLQPERYIATLERRVEARAGKLMFGVDATGWRIEGRRIVALQTTEGEIVGDEFILAGGAWSPQMLGSLRLRLPMQPGKGYSITIPEPVELPQICAILTEARVAVTPMNKALRFGGTMEIAGLNDAINARRVQGIINAARLYFPKFGADQFAGLQPWQGIRPCSPDGLPYLGRATAAPSNLVIATAHAMMGLSLAPVTGEIAGQLVDGESPRFDLQLLSPDRYQ